MGVTVPDFGKVVSGFLATILLLPIAGAVGLATIHFQGHKLLSVQTASMLPAIQPGDALIVSPIQPGQLRLGDVISYHDSRDPNVIISHRLISIDPKTSWLTTAGDALHTPDPSFPPNLLIGQATAIAPRLGLILGALHHPIGLILTIYIPATLIVTAEVNHLAHTYARPSYSARL